MQARIKQTARWGTLSFFSGVEYTKSEWRPVPHGKEDEARSNDWLEVADGTPVTLPLVVTEAAPPEGVHPAIDAQNIVEVAQESETINSTTSKEPDAKSVTNNTHTRNHKRGR